MEKLAMLTGNKRVELVPAREIQTITGYLRGGCSPLAMKRHYPTYLDVSALEHAFIVVSAGLRGTQIKLAPEDLIQASGAIKIKAVAT